MDCPGQNETDANWFWERSRSRSADVSPGYSFPRSKKNTPKTLTARTEGEAGILCERTTRKKNGMNTRLNPCVCEGLHFTLGVGSHTEEADLVRVQVRSGEGAKVSLLFSLLPVSDERGGSGVWGSVLSSSLSISRATRLGLEWRMSNYTHTHTLSEYLASDWFKSSQIINIIIPRWGHTKPLLWALTFPRLKTSWRKQRQWYFYFILFCVNLI